MVNYYDLSYDEKLDLYTVRNKKKDVTYTLRPKSDGGFAHTCKAILVYGDDYLCRHKKLILKKYFVNKDFEYKFNLTKK
jgi:hypothetical protein